MKLFTALRASASVLLFLSTSSAYAVSASASWSPSTAQTGQTQTFSWSSTGAHAGCVLNSSNTGVAASGSYSVTAGSPGTYSDSVTCLSFVGEFGIESDTAAASRTVTAPAQAPTVNAHWSPSSREQNSGNQTFSWSSTNATSCSLGGASGNFSVAASTVGSFTQSVTCTGAGGSASTSATRTVTAPPPPPPPVPTVSASWSPSSRQVNTGNQTFSWSSTNASSCSLGGSSGSITASASSVGSFTQSVTCTGAGGSASASATRTVTAAPPPPPPPVPGQPVVSVPSTDADGNYTVSWTSVSGATSYQLMIDLAGGGTAWQTIYTGSATSRSESGRPNGTHGYVARACNASGCSGYSGRKDITVNLPPLPTVTASWNPNPANTGSDATLTWNATHATSCTLPSISGNQPTSGTHVYPINTSSNWNPTLSCTGAGGTKNINVPLTVDPAPPVPVLNPLGAGGIPSWNSVSGATSYEFRLYLDVPELGLDEWVTVYTGPLTAYSTGVSPGALYSVRACNGTDCSAWSGSTTAPVPPAIPTLTVNSKVAGANGVSITWNEPQTANWYNFSINDDGTNTRLLTNGNNSYIETRPVGNYSYGIRACESAAETNCSAWGWTPVTVTPAAPSFNPLINNPDGTKTINWNPSEGATSYHLEFHLFFTGDLAVDEWIPVTLTSSTSAQAVEGDFNYRVFGCAGEICSQPSSSTVSSFPAPGAPVLTAPDMDDDGSYSVSWADVPGTNITYKIEINGEPVSGNVTSPYVETAKPSGTYTYTVAACNTSNVCTWSAPKPVEVLSSTGLITASWTTAPPGATQTFDWSASTTIFSQGCSMSGFSGVSGNVGSTTATAPAAPGTYSTTIACTGGAFPFDFTVTQDVPRIVSAPETPNIPTGLAVAAPNNGNYDVSWNPVSGTNITYKLEINGTLTSAVTSPYPETNKPAGTYTYAVMACDGPANCSDLSSSQSVTVLPAMSDLFNGDVNGIGGTTEAPIVWGWACETNKATPINVKLLVGDAGSLTELKTVTADRTSDAAVQNACGTTGAHNYQIPITTQELDDHQGKAIHVYTSFTPNPDTHGVGLIEEPLPNSGTHTVPLGSMPIPNLQVTVTQYIPIMVGDMLILTPIDRVVDLQNDMFTIEEGSFKLTWSSEAPEGSTYKLFRDGSEITTGIVGMTYEHSHTQGTYVYMLVTCDNEGNNCSEPGDITLNVSPDYSLLPIPGLMVTVQQMVPVLMGDITTFIEANIEANLTDGSLTLVEDQPFTLNWNSEADAGIYILTRNGSEVYSGADMSTTDTVTTPGSYNYSLKVCEEADITDCSPSVELTVHILTESEFAALSGIADEALKSSMGYCNGKTLPMLRTIGLSSR